MKKQNYQSGFTLVEVLVVLAISIMVLIFSPVLFSERQKAQRLEATCSEMLSVLRQAQSQSVSGKASSNWGVYFDETDNAKYILYAGSSFLTRNELFDLEFETENEFSWSLNPNLNDINFSRTNGFPNESVLIMINDLSGPTGKQIDINKIGKIERDG